MFNVWNNKEQRMWLTLVRSFGTLEQKLSADMEQENGLPMAWYDVLVALYHYDTDDGMCMNQLADTIMMSNSGLTRLIDRIIEAGLIERNRAKDRRMVFVSLTTVGKQRIESVFPQHQQRVKDYFLSHLSDDEMSIIQQVFQRVLSKSERS